ncbi:MAG TPA: class I SAM-dependent methyltransferase [Cytophagales bacterium]|nr:class I SAM-dependent methyltransferase [Cytophagales bacterium]
MTFLNFKTNPATTLNVGNKNIHIFDENQNKNIDWEVVNSFGNEWSRFNNFEDKEIDQIGDQYFDIAKNILNKNTLVLDVGCGTGRWSKYLSGKVKSIEAIDPSEAVFAASKLLENVPNVRISKAGVDAMPFEDNSFDLVFSLGVLHHIPNTAEAMKQCVKKVKPGGHFLVYLYYALDNRGRIFKSLFYASNIVRSIVSKLPQGLKNLFCDLIAFFIYGPFVLLSKLINKIPILKRYVHYLPLSFYKDTSFHIIRNDALDRFGTSLEQRFSKEEIGKMMTACGLTNIQFSEREPYWHAIGQKGIS